MTCPAFLDNLKSQRAEIKAAIDAGKCIVYGYLRAKTSVRGKAGSPYYIGIASRHDRPYERHRRGSKQNSLHDVPVPRDESRVRVFGVFESREIASVREICLIAKYGRQRLDPAGKLLNRTVGGDNGVLGVTHSKKIRERMSQSREPQKLQAADRYGVPHKAWLALSFAERNKVRLRHKGGRRGEDLLVGLTNGAKPVQKDTANKYGVPLDWYLSLSKAELKRFSGLALNGSRGSDLMALTKYSLNAKLMQTAKRLGLAAGLWSNLPYSSRQKILKRHRRGKRGEELLVGIAA